jgi:hypothetical protein
MPDHKLKQLYARFDYTSENAWLEDARRGFPRKDDGGNMTVPLLNKNKRRASRSAHGLEYVEFHQKIDFSRY